MFKKPSENLEGLILKNDWKVIRKASKEELSSGGRFTVPYVVSDGNQEAWLKAMDLMEAFLVSDEQPTRLIEKILADYNYEADLHKICLGNKLKNVVRVLDVGEIIVDKENPYSKVFYLILEKGKDLHQEMKIIENVTSYWIFKTIHHVTKGLNQLHTIKIAHQDLKPSNIISFPNIIKIGDLGSASYKETIRSLPSSIDEKKIPGSYSYAPPELLYGEVSNDWDTRRKASDIYQLGSLLVFLLCKRNMTEMIKSHLHPSLWWDKDNDISSYRNVIDHVVRAFERAIVEIESDLNDEYLIEKCIPVIRQLCNPYPEKRGHPKSIAEIGSNYSLYRYITIFDVFSSHFKYNISNGKI